MGGWFGRRCGLRRPQRYRGGLLFPPAAGVVAGALTFFLAVAVADAAPPPPKLPRTGGPQLMALIAGGGREVIEQGTFDCTRAGEPLRVSISVTQSGTHAAGVWSKHCKVAVHNANGMFAKWKLTLTAKHGKFHPGGAVLDYVYSRGRPLKEIFHSSGEIQLFAQAKASIVLDSVMPLVLAALAAFAGLTLVRRRPRAT